MRLEIEILTIVHPASCWVFNSTFLGPGHGRCEASHARTLALTVFAVCQSCFCCFLPPPGQWESDHVKERPLLASRCLTCITAPRCPSLGLVDVTATTFHWQRRNPSENWALLLLALHLRRNEGSRGCQPQPAHIFSQAVKPEPGWMRSWAVPWQP